MISGNTACLRSKSGGTLTLVPKHQGAEHQIPARQIQMNDGEAALFSVSHGVIAPGKMLDRTTKDLGKEENRNIVFEKSGRVHHGRESVSSLRIHYAGISEPEPDQHHDSQTKEGAAAISS